MLVERLALKAISPVAKLGLAILLLGGVFAAGFYFGDKEATEACRIKQLESDNEQLEEDIGYVEEWFAKQKEILEGADADLDLQIAAIRSIQRNVANLSKTYEELAAREPLDPSCDAGPVRVQAANQAIRSANSGSVRPPGELP